MPSLNNTHTYIYNALHYIAVVVVAAVVVAVVIVVVVATVVAALVLFCLHTYKPSPLLGLSNSAVAFSVR